MAGVGPFRAGFAEPEGVEHREQVVFHVHPVILRRIGAVQPVDVGVQHLGNRNFAEIALDCVWCSKQGFFVLAEIFVFSGIGEGVFGGFFQAEQNVPGYFVPV